jgi:hypothetical protein
MPWFIFHQPKTANVARKIAKKTKITKTVFLFKVNPDEENFIFKSIIGVWR